MMVNFQDDMARLVTVIEKIYLLRYKTLCKATGEVGRCSNMVELMVDQSKPSHLVNVKGGYEPIFPTYRHPSKLCRFHRELQADNLI